MRVSTIFQSRRITALSSNLNPLEFGIVGIRLSRIDNVTGVRITENGSVFVKRRSCDAFIYTCYGNLSRSLFI